MQKPNRLLLGRYMKEVYVYMKYSIEEMFDTEYMTAEARFGKQLTDEEIAVLYLGKYFEIFENPNIYISNIIIMDYLTQYIPAINFFTRKDVKDNLEEAVNVYIDNFASNWMRKYPSMAGVSYFSEIANKELVTNLKEMLEMDISITEENLETLHKYGTDFFKEAVETLREKIQEKQ